MTDKKTAAASDDHDKPCPDCGYCPTCGRARQAYPYIVPMPMPYPVHPNPAPMYPWRWQQTTGGTVTINATTTNLKAVS